MNPDYDDHDRERRIVEPAKPAARTPFARDRARVLHSSALRRLGGKTQVMGAGHDDFVRTRLTHSLEVAQVGRELASTLGCDPDVVDTACLAHDFGHPPFGHNGEQALAEVMAGFGGFEGNAQSFRLLTRLEPKITAPDGTAAGLNLTRASLDASLKYPWTASQATGPKFGVYDDDLAAFTWVRERAGAGRCVEAQVMDFSDDVAYSVHDVEDAVVGGRVDLARLADPQVGAGIAALARDWYLPHTEPGQIVAALDRLRTHPWWVGEYDGSRRSLAGLKDMTSTLIGRFCRAASLATLGRYGPGRLIRHEAELVVPAQTLVEVAALKGVAAFFVMAEPQRSGEYAAERALLTRLVTALRDDDGAGLPALFAADYRQAGDEAGRMRAVVDHVASLTDASARALAARLGVLGST